MAAANPAAAAEAMVGSYAGEDVHSLALLSDGASRLADRSALTDWSGMIALLAHHGPDTLLEQVRAAENADLDGTRWPRGKTHDDATAIYCTL